MATTDWHTHWLPQPLVDALAKRTEGPRIDTAARQLRYANSALTLWEIYHDIDKRLASLDAWGIQRQVLSLPGLFRIDSLPVEEAAPLLDIFNTETLALVQRHPDRFAGLAALPIADARLSAEWLERLLAGGGLRGAILPVDAFLDEAAAQEWRPVLEVANRHAAHLFIHPGPTPTTLAAPAVAAPKDNPGYRAGAHDIQSRLTSAAITFGFTPLLDDYPALTLQLANLGGTLPFIVERFDAVDLRDKGAVQPRERLRRLHVDTASLGVGAIGLAARVLGADRILLGTDLPIFDPRLPLEGIAASGLPQQDIQRLLEGNGLWR